MAEKRTFAEILQEKLGRPHYKEAQKSKIPPPTTAFFGMETPLFGPVFSWKPAGKQYVVRKKTPTPQAIVEEQAPPPEAPSISIELLNKSEISAWNQIQSMGALKGLEDITEMQLKRAYRTLAKKYHPDKESGSPEAFLALQEAYSILLKGFYRVIATCDSESASA